MNEQPLYDDPRLAASYARVSARNLYNARYERPALRRIVGDPDGLDLLDAGCASGEHAAWFAQRGAKVTALDASAAMTAIARDRLGAGGRVLQHDLREPLPFASRSFDVIASSLTLHYVEAWAPVLDEFARVIRPGGRLVLSTHHPSLTPPDGRYFDVHEVSETWRSFDPAGTTVRFFHRPLCAIVASIVGAGFRLDALHEPRLDEPAELDASSAAAKLRSEPLFLIVEATLATAPASS